MTSMTPATAGLFLGISLALCFAPTPAAAQSGRQACESDAFRLCSQFIPDERSVGSCLRRNMRSLSPACRAAFGGGKAAKKKKKRVRRR